MTANKNKSNMRVRDMTEGNIIKHILWFAIPLFIGNIFQQIYSIVDTMVAGYNLGDSAIAAIGATSSLYSLIINLAVGLNSGYAIIVTQRFGAHDVKNLKKSIAGMFKLDAFMAVFMTIFSLVFLHPMLNFMNVPESIYNQAYIYIAVIFSGIIATVSYNMFASILRAFGNSATSLYFLIISSVINIVMDLVLVVGFNTGVVGAAIATVIAQSISAILCGIYIFTHYKEYLPEREDFNITGQMVKELLGTGVAMALMYCVVDLGSVIFQGANNNLGDVYITAHTAARRWVMLFMSPLGTMANANSTFVGQNFGAGKFERIKKGIKKVMLLEVSWGITACILVYIFGAFLIKITTGTNDAEVISNAVLSLRIHTPLYAPLGILLALRTSMQSMGYKNAPVISSSMELAMKIVSAIWLIPRFGFLGTCCTEPVTWVICMLFLVSIYIIRRKQIFNESRLH